MINRTCSFGSAQLAVVQMLTTNFITVKELQHEVGALLEFRDLVIETFPDLKQKMAISAASTSSSTGCGGNVLSNGQASEVRSNSHSGKRSKSNSGGGGAVSNSGGSAGATSGGEHNNGSVVQDSGFSTETSSSKEGHSASSSSGALTTTIASNRLSCPESDDELLNLLDVIPQIESREEVEHLQEPRTHLQPDSSVERIKTTQQLQLKLNKEDLQQLRKERDRLLDKLAEMEAETLTGRIKATKMSEQVEELIAVKKDLEEQLKLAMQQRLELTARVQQLQQQQLSQSKSSSSQSDASAVLVHFSSSSNTVLSTVSTNSSRQNTFQPVVVEQQTADQQQNNNLLPFPQSIGSDSKRNSQLQQFAPEQLGRLDGIVSTPGDRNTKCRVTDSKRFAAILLETNVIELRRHLLTLTVKNQLEEKNIELEGTKAQLRVLESDCIQ
ncbi:hypothetical protein EVAR_73020_1 [Eumeta japonica]|uniref:Uncharacterized protein n=1 Tax=Eumeta variegata TaxID=151549 RepID=A0A4C1T6U3_EUMVA|nr:hypothetical protein EVAR_73020_1 [Eumeta japonica]